MLHNDAMIVRLTISKWTARKFDRGVSKHVAQDYGTDSDAGRYNKVLIAKEAMKNITKAETAARQFHYENTLPWDDAGGRILPSAKFQEYSKAMREFREAYEKAVREFIENYPEYRKEAEKRLARMFDPTDYPTVYDIGRKFAFGVGIEPVPYSGDFRVKLQAKDREEIAKALDESVDQRLKAATRDLYKRLAEVTKKFAERLADPEAIFRDSLVENVVELTNLLPDLNLEKDPELEKLRKEVVKKIATHEPDTLRADATVRKSAVKDAKAILKKMDGYFG